jgi:hypothetical protein
MSIPRTAILAITMPTRVFLRELTMEHKVSTFTEAERHVKEKLSNYELLICKPLDYKVMFPMNSPLVTLHLMESFNFIKPLPKKIGQMVFLCTYVDAYQSYCCVESVIMSLLFNPELDVPDIARPTQLKERERAARANPFTAATFDQEKLKEKERR